LLKRRNPTAVHVKSIQPCVGKVDSKKLAKISLADSSIEICIDQLAKDIEFQVLEKIHTPPFCYSR